MVKGALDGVTPFLFCTIRFVAAVIIVTLLFPQKLRGMTKSGVLRGGLLGVFLFVGFMLQTIGLQYTTASKSAFFTGMLVVCTPLVQFIWQRRLPSFGNLLGTLLAAFGLYLLTAPTGASFNAGDGMTLICSLIFGAYIVYLGMVSVDTDRYHLMYIQNLTVAVFGLMCTPFFENAHIEYNFNVIGSIAYLAIFATLVTGWVQVRYQGDTTPTRASVIFTLEPVIAATSAYFVRGEMLGMIGIAGATVILFGILVSELSGEVPFLNRTLAGGEGGR